MIKKVILIALSCTTFNLFAQNNPEEELGAWYIFATNTKLTDNFSIQAQTQMRYYELLNEVQQFKIRVGGTYQFAKGFSGSLGYAYFRNDPSYGISQLLTLHANCRCKNFNSRHHVASHPGN